MSPALKWGFLALLAIITVAAAALVLTGPDQPESAGAPNYQLPLAALDGDKPPVHVDEAFALIITVSSEKFLQARFDIKPNFYLYRDKISVTGSDGALLQPVFPASKTRRDQHFGDSEVFDQSFSFTTPLPQTSDNKIKVSATYQGCENEGICYPPTTKHFVLGNQSLR